jgi:hypothetical protein
MPTPNPARSLSDPIEENVPFSATPWKTLLRLYRPEAKPLLLAFATTYEAPRADLRELTSPA